jgi:hypothetical protein
VTEENASLNFNMLLGGVYSISQQINYTITAKKLHVLMTYLLVYSITVPQNLPVSCSSNIHFWRANDYRQST